MKSHFFSRRQPFAVTPTDRLYCKTTNRLGWTLLLFWLLFGNLETLFLPVVWLAELFMTPDGCAAVSDVCGSVAYLLSFMLPAIFFCLITPKAERVPMMLSPRMPKGTVCLVLTGIVITSAAATLNSTMVSWFGYHSSFSDIFESSSTMKDYEGVLLFIGTALVPAFSEEFLFRGVVCNNLRPYGKTVAVLGSAILFGIMHQNIGQLFYATVAGIVLAVIYLETASIWPSVLLHLFNNLISVVYDIVGDRLDAISSNRVLAIMDGFSMILGLLALLIPLALADRSREKSAGVFSLLRGEKWDEEIAVERTVSPGCRVRGFLTPGMLAFCILAIADMILLLVIVLAYRSR